MKPQELNALTGKRVHINVVEIKKLDLDAHLVGAAAEQLEDVLLSVVLCVVPSNVLCVPVLRVSRFVAGRLNGADMSLDRIIPEGTVPLHTLRADIDYSWMKTTTYGALYQDLDLLWRSFAREAKTKTLSKEGK